MSKTFETIRDAIIREAIQVSRHALHELEEDGLFLDQILAAVLAGEAIEDYPTDPRGPSCLVCSALGEGLWVHTVWGRDPTSGIAVLITVYRPTPEKWEDDFKTRMR
jgi:Domain of unknown function (DUF4258)